MVQCTSVHLTSFAVLVDVRGVQVRTKHILSYLSHKASSSTVHLFVLSHPYMQINAKALSIVSYIGLSLSLVSLLVTIIFFISFGYAVAALLN